MNRSALARWAATGMVLLLAASVVGWQYRDYLINPWTRDGLVSSRVVLLAPQVSGAISRVHIAENTQVRQGDLLFELDDAPFTAALRKAEAQLTSAEALAALAEAEARRAQDTERGDPGALSPQTVQDAILRAKAAQATVQAEQAALEQARQQLAFTRVSAPADGYITGPALAPGGAVPAFKPILGLIRSDSFRIKGFFRETLIRHIAVGQKASVRLMSRPDLVLSGTVESVGWGIARSDGSTSGVSEDLLPVVSPTFEWIRLAQRIPVIVRLDQIPPGLLLRMGETASVMIHAVGGNIL